MKQIKYYLAIDIGASSGRHILGWLENGKIRIEEIYRFENGLIEEVKNILKMWYTKNDFWLKTIWYTEVLDYLDEKISLDEAISIVSQHNRNYAKRQLTWFRKYEK